MLEVKKGPESEYVEVGKIGDKSYAFINENSKDADGSLLLDAGDKESVIEDAKNMVEALEEEGVDIVIGLTI